MKELWQGRWAGYGLASIALLWAAMAGLWPLLFIGLVPLLFLVRIESSFKRFFWCTLVGTLHYIIQMYWIVIVLGRYGGLPIFLTIPALLFLGIYLGCYFGLFGLIVHQGLKKWNNILILWLLPICWVGLDWIKSWLFTGLPWMDLGYGLADIYYLIQPSDLIGHYAATFLIIQLNVLFFLLLQNNLFRSKLPSLLCGLVVTALFFVYGNLRLEQVEKEMADADQVIVGVVQGNIDQNMKWSPRNKEQTIDKYIGLTESLFLQKNKNDEAAAQGPELVVWPETALPFFPTRSNLTEKLVKTTTQRKLPLLTGSPWFQVKNREKREVEYYNSALLLKPEGVVDNLYFKSHLVPFGEYVPLKEMLPFIEPLVEAAGDFTPGKVEQPLQASKIKSGVLICFESIFPEIGREWVNTGSNLLVNITNDAWYGRSSAPKQSMAMTIFRAVETRRSLVRAANTGISGFIDPTGKVLASSEIFVDWAKMAEVSLLDEKTFYVRYGYLFGPLCGAVIFVVLCWSLILRRRDVLNKE